MRNFPGLVRRDSGIYYVRIRVPEDLIGVLKCRELKKSLQTTDLREARRSYQRVFAEMLHSINEARARIAKSASSASPVPKDELERAVRDWFFGLWDRCEREYIAPPPDGPDVDDMLSQAKFELQELARPDDDLRGALLLQARKLLADRGHVNPEVTAIADLASYIARGLRLINVRLIDHFEKHRFFPAIDDPLFQHDAAAHSACVSTKPGLSVSALIERFNADPQRQKLSPKNRLGFAMAFRALKEIAGADTPIAAVSREHAREIQALLSKLPPNATKRFRGIPLTRVAKLAEERSLKPLEAKTAENILRNMSAFFSWAVKEHHISRHPFEGLRPLQEPKRPDEERQPFDEGSLVKMFSSSIYAECRDDTRHPGRYWIPLLGLYHGPRLNEACQLETSDVAVEEGIPVFRMRRDSENGHVKRIKNDPSVRTVPIHPKMLDLGFMEFVNRQRGSGQTLLFPDVRLSRLGYRSDHFQKWFARFRRKAGLTDRRTSFHSFRHNFTDAARAANIPAEIVEEIGGWSGGKSMRGRYGKGHSILRKRDEIAKIAYPCVDGILTRREAAPSPPTVGVSATVVGVPAG